MKEVFQPIPGFNNYLISNLGKIKSLGGRDLKYLDLKDLKFINRLMLRKISKFQFDSGYGTISSLVLLTFIGPRPQGMVVSYLNGNKFDNRLCNLKWEIQKKTRRLIKK